jgi:RimJ/RimL family protein N-acetyltransferase
MAACGAWSPRRWARSRVGWRPRPPVRARSAVARLSDEIGWVAKTWGGPAGLAASGHAYGAFAGGRLAAVTCSFFQGARYADAGVVTEPERRGQGLGVASARAWCAGTVAHRRVPTWTTSTDNSASRRIAERLGFALVRRDVLHVIGVAIPS